MMTFIQRYTDNLKVDMRLGIDKSVGQTGLTINDFLTKSHGQVARDLSDPREWYHSTIHRDLLETLKGELEAKEKGTTTVAKSNLVPTKGKATNRYGIHRFRVKQKNEKKGSRKRTASKTGYAMPNTTPEPHAEPETTDDSDVDESNPANNDPRMSRMSSSIPPPSHSPLRIPSAHYNDDQIRNFDNATVNSFKMREFLDDIIKTDRNGKRSIDISDSFVLPSIPLIRGDFLPHLERTRQLKSSTNVSPEKELPCIDTRSEAIEDDREYIHDLAPWGHKKVDDGKKKAVNVKFSETGSKPKVSSSDFIDNWITTLKTPRESFPLPSGPQHFISRKTIQGNRELARRYTTTRQPPKGDYLSIGSSKVRIGGAQLSLSLPDTLDNAIRIPSANEPLPPPPQVPNSPKKLRRDVGNYSAKASALASGKIFAVVDDNLFKKHIATTEIKLNGIESQIDDLFNRNVILRKSVGRPLIDRSAASEKPNSSDKNECTGKSVNDGTETREPKTTSSAKTSPRTTHLSGNKSQDIPPRAPSVVSIEFGGGGEKTGKTEDKDKKVVVFRGSSFKSGLPATTKSTTSPRSPRRYRIGGSKSVHTPPPPQVRVTRVEVFSEHRKRAHYLAPRRKHSVEANYDSFARRKLATANEEMTASQAFAEFGIQPANETDMVATPNTERSCFSNLSERGYFADEDSESSDPEILIDS